MNFRQVDYICLKELSKNDVTSSREKGDKYFVTTVINVCTKKRDDIYGWAFG